jgi:hypothetical protein
MEAPRSSDIFNKHLPAYTASNRYLGKQSLFAVTIMLNTEIYCVGRIHSSLIHTNSVRTSQGTHYVSATKPNWLMLFRETVAVYYENRTEHTNTLCG